MNYDYWGRPFWSGYHFTGFHWIDEGIERARRPRRHLWLLSQILKRIEEERLENERKNTLKALTQMSPIGDNGVLAQLRVAQMQVAMQQMEAENLQKLIQDDEEVLALLL